MEAVHRRDAGKRPIRHGSQKRIQDSNQGDYREAVSFKAHFRQWMSLRAREGTSAAGIGQSVPDPDCPVMKTWIVSTEKTEGRSALWVCSRGTFGTLPERDVYDSGLHAHVAPRQIPRLVGQKRPSIFD